MVEAPFFPLLHGEATDVTVTCKMENTKIQLVYSTEMQTSFTSWSITVKADARSKVLTYSGTEAFAQPSAFYWMLDEGVKEITVSFVGKNKDNKDIREPCDHEARLGRELRLAGWRRVGHHDEAGHL